MIVSYSVHSTPWSIHQKLIDLGENSLMSFDIETKGLYGKEQRKEALMLVGEDLDVKTHGLVSVVAHNNGLSFPSLVRTTHFIFGMSKQTSVVLVPQSLQMEMRIWNWLIDYSGKLLIHNTLFDLKVMYHRVKALPSDYEDTALMLKTLINNSDVWKAKVGLKDVMGEYYSPSWSLFDEYEPENDKDPKILEYAAIDGAATYFLYEMLLENS